MAAKQPKGLIKLPSEDFNANSSTATDVAEPQFAERVAETLKPYLRNPAEARQAVTRVVEITESYSGPTPHPAHLERIELIAPGSAKQIIGMAILEQKHRHTVSLLAMLYPYCGLATGFVVAVTCFYLAYLLGMAGHDSVAAALVSVSALGVIGWFIRSRLSPASSDSSDSAPSSRSARASKRR